ncbi:MAG TPA: GDSL-type esterase/lipase family protein, partial [Bacteroidales bacterium]|nr:GDSL-type esterase/lipase family protein [Bacteroidales bacterium]
MVGMTGFRTSIIRRIAFLAFALITYTVAGQEPLKIMPLGNSITRGSMCVNGNIYYSCVLNADSNAIGYRYRLYNLLNAAGYNFDFVGKHSYGYAIFDDPDNSGFDGIRSWQLADIMETGTSSSYNGQETPGPYLNYYPADIILLHIGTNDVLAGSTSVADVSRILDAIDTYENVSGKPVIVFLATILSEKNYPCDTHSGTIAFNTNLAAMAQARIQNGDHIVLVDMECGAGLDYYNDLVDQVHPDEAGYSKMGDMWFQAINNFNSAPLISSIPEQVTWRGTSFDTLNLDNYVTDVENTAQQMTWSVSPADPQYFNVVINSDRQVIVTPKDTAWSGSESLQFNV